MSILPIVSLLQRGTGSCQGHQQQAWTEHLQNNTQHTTKHNTKNPDHSLGAVSVKGEALVCFHQPHSHDSRATAHWGMANDLCAHYYITVYHVLIIGHLPFWFWFQWLGLWSAPEPVGWCLGGGPSWPKGGGERGTGFVAAGAVWQVLAWHWYGIWKVLGNPCGELSCDGGVDGAQP